MFFGIRINSYDNDYIPGIGVWELLKSFVFTLEIKHFSRYIFFETTFGLFTSPMVAPDEK